MIDEPTLELIHADIDGCLPDSERVALSRRLLADPEARALHREMQWLRDRLAAVPSEEVPAGVTAAIVAATPAPTGAIATTPGSGRRPARPWAYFGALAAAVAIAAVMLRIGSDAPGYDATGTVGTMADPPAAPVVPLDRPEVRGSVRVTRSGATLVVDFDVALHEQVEIVALRDHRALGNLARGADDGRRQRFSIEIPAGAGDEAAVTVRLSTRGRLIEEVTLPVPGGP